MKKKEIHTFYNYQFKHTAVRVTNHPDIRSVDVADALNIHPIMLYRWRGEMRTGKLKDNDQEARSISELNTAEKKVKKYARALEVIEKYERTFDPIRPPKSEMESIGKRKERLIKKLKGAN